MEPALLVHPIEVLTSFVVLKSIDWSRSGIQAIESGYYLYAFPGDIGELTGSDLTVALAPFLRLPDPL